METLYFVGVSLGIGGIILWAYIKDDQADFIGQKRDEKFTAERKKDDENANSAEIKTN